MNDLSFLKGLLDNKLKESLIELSKEDMIVEKILEKTTNVQEYINSITAAIICIVAREREFSVQIKKLIESNPNLKQIIN